MSGKVLMHFPDVAWERPRQNGKKARRKHPLKEIVSSLPDFHILKLLLSRLHFKIIKIRTWNLLKV